MTNMKKIKSAFLNGNISKAEFIHDIYEHYHQSLFEYAELLKETDISNIQICDDAVIMTSRSRKIQLICPKDDQRSSPIEIFNFGNYESEYSEFLYKMCNSKSVIFDIGSNIGYYTTGIAKQYPNAHVYAFEPIPKTFHYLNQNIALNNLVNVSTFPFGLSDKTGMFDFYYYKEGSGNASLANLSERWEAEVISCQLETLDHVVDRLGVEIDVIKCDVEGAEYFAFKGGMNSIEKYRPIIFTEMLRKWTKAFSYHPNRILELLSSVGYRCFRVQAGMLQSTNDINDLTTETNFVFIDPIRHQNILKTFTR